MSSFVLATAMVLASVACAFAALVFLTVSQGALSRRNPRVLPLLPQLEPTVFLFEEENLVDATEPAKRLLASLEGAGSQWQRLATYLHAYLPDIESALASLSTTGRIRLQSRTRSGLALEAEHLGESVRITLSDQTSEGQRILIDGLSLLAQEQEISAHRETLSLAPCPIWRTSTDGRLTWTNQRYLELVRAQIGNDLVWPLPEVFASSTESDGVRSRAFGSGEWFDCYCRKVENGFLRYALPAESAVVAEASLKSFLQTLSRTFAELSTGLAIFDRERRLATFNPALTDLTTLSGEFLSARPTLVAFLDRLRETQVMPEPKDYPTWRQKIEEMEKAAAEGYYEEIWVLPTGQTYRLRGRPHPDGALALLLEDVSSEVSDARRLRSEIELGHVVLNEIGDAIAVFAPTGTLILSNSAYASLWGIDSEAALGKITLVDSVRRWQAMAMGAVDLATIAEFVGDPFGRDPLHVDMALKNGGMLVCRIAALKGGSTLVRFSQYEKRHPEQPDHDHSTEATPATADSTAA